MNTHSKPMANASVATPLSMARTDGRTNERVSHLPETSPVTYRARENQPLEPYPDREFTEFLDRVRNRWRKSSGRGFLARNCWVDTPGNTRRKNYDAETERLRRLMNEGRAA